jgi:2-polyprenyl-3-methyl-5-hydroxy-6-metoxy-1,4-benzoquinol methylase
MAQLEETIPPIILYSDYNYCFSAWKSQPHITDECELIQRFMPSGTILEVGCNDGLFLLEVAKYGDYNCIGVEPNKVSSKEAQDKGVRVINQFFEEAINAELKDVSVQVLVARQVLEHIIDVDLFLAAANRMLDLGGLICIEVPNTNIALTSGDVSCLWEEHVNYFTPLSLLHALEGFGFKVLVNKTYQFSGEAILIIAEKIDHIVEFIKPLEVNNSNFIGFADSINEYKKLLLDTLETYRMNNWLVVMYGSGCRASTAIHSLELTPLLDSIVDDQTEKQGLYMPRVSIPVSSSNSIKQDSRVLFLLAVNNENEQKVIQKINQLDLDQFETLTLHSPSNIKEELQRVSSKIIYAT